MDGKWKRNILVMWAHSLASKFPDLQSEFRSKVPSCLHRHSALSRASSRRLRPGAVPWAASDPGDRFGRALERPHGPVLPAVASKTHGPAGPAVAGDGQQSVVTRLCRVMDTSRRPPICWPQRGPVVRRPRLTSGPRGPYLPCRNTSRPASARETPNAEARGCVRRRRTPRVDGR